ncbi:uncharacterized protein ACWYII_038083 isoform 2-T2 [Salvelinus alpinus]
MSRPPLSSLHCYSPPPEVKTQGTDVRYRNCTEEDKTLCRDQIKGIHRVRALCCILRLTFLMEETAETYLKQSNEHLNLILVSLQKKEALVGFWVLAHRNGYHELSHRNGNHELSHRNGHHELSPGGKPQADRRGLPGDGEDSEDNGSPTTIIEQLETHCQAQVCNHSPQL